MTDPARDVRVRELAVHEMPRTDAVYDELRFARSDPANTRMLCAESGGEMVGLGRLIDLGPRADDGSDDEGGARVLELGGIWVAESARRQGIAGRLVAGLLDLAPPDAEVWCLPFEDLLPLYAAHGFLVEPVDAAPAALEPRYRGCASEHERRVVLTRLA
ncbi:MAG: GNAT family N-acetyltransferase [Planctomycetota bacterium]